MALKPSVCVDAVFEKHSLREAVSQVKSCGIDAFEFWGWWDKDLDELVSIRDDSKMSISACCTRFISLVDPATRKAYLEGIEQTIAAAKKLGVTTIISQVGDFRRGVDRSEQQECLVEGLRAAAPMLETADVTLTIEPLNDLVDHPGYYLVHSDEAFEIIDAVNSANVKVVYDIYHQQISEGHLIHNITQNIDKIAHFHAAGNPGRHELTCGEIDYPSVFDAIHATEYDGFVGLEYWPKGDAASGLAEVAKWFD